MWLCRTIRSILIGDRSIVPHTVLTIGHSELVPLQRALNALLPDVVAYSFSFSFPFAYVLVHFSTDTHSASMPSLLSKQQNALRGLLTLKENMHSCMRYLKHGWLHVELQIIKSIIEP